MKTTFKKKHLNISVKKLNIVSYDHAAPKMIEMIYQPVKVITTNPTRSSLFPDELKATEPTPRIHEKCMF